jgi:hypothetical protein
VYDFARLQGETIEEDLAQRDFTVNAMARPLVGSAAAARAGATSAPQGGDLIDPMGGRADLDARTLRVLGAAAYENDPLRPLRLARFAAELGFRPDPDTERLTSEAAPRVSEASGERVFAELRRLLVAPGAVEALGLGAEPQRGPREGAEPALPGAAVELGSAPENGDAESSDVAGSESAEGNPEPLAALLRSWLTDSGLRAEWRRRALAGRDLLPGWDATARQVLGYVAPEAGPGGHSSQRPADGE